MAKNSNYVSNRELYNNLHTFRLEVLEQMETITDKSEEHLTKLIGQMNENTSALVGQINETMRIVNCKVDKVDENLDEHKDDDRTLRIILTIGTIILLTVYPLALTYVPKAIAAII